MSPIPAFDYNHVLPPHLGSPSKSQDLSPYECTIMELCQRFTTSKARTDILIGLVNFRIKMSQFGISQGFQWLDGSFVEDIETVAGRPPKDVDLVTFYKDIPMAEQVQIVQSFPEFRSTALSKQQYKVDHYAVDYAYTPESAVELTRYWIQLFTHNRNGIWKGILRLPINTPSEDQHALAYLLSLSI